MTARPTRPRFAGAPRGATGNAIAAPNYRYVLQRRWDPSAKVVLVVGLNPSTADASSHDPTTRMVMRQSRRDGYGGFVLVNLFAARATNPRELTLMPDPVGPGNDGWIQKAARSAEAVWVAWGSVGSDIPGFAQRVNAVTTLLGERSLLCQGTTKHGHPRHPLYNREPLQPWSLTTLD